MTIFLIAVVGADTNDGKENFAGFIKLGLCHYLT
jgi:hypothetical protein